jgi:GxxExxY protein
MNASLESLTFSPGDLLCGFKIARRFGMYLYQKLSELVVDAFYSVHRGLGPGLLERVYHKALLREFEVLGVPAASQVPFQVVYKERLIGEYYADLVVNDRILVEVKAVGG